MLNFVFFSAFIINESAVLVQVHKHRHAGEAWLTVIREKPMRLRKDQSDLIYSQRSQVVTPIKSSGLMLPPPAQPQASTKPQLSSLSIGEGSLTQEQHIKTIQKDSMMPAMPTTQVSRRKRMTPKMFCRHGRYTPMKVPMRGACQRGQHQSLQPNSLAHTSSMFLPCLSLLASPPFHPSSLWLLSPFLLSTCLQVFPVAFLMRPSKYLLPPLLHLHPSSPIPSPTPHSHRPPPFFCVIHSSIQIHFLSHPFSPKAPPAPASFFHPHCSPLLHALCFPGAGWCSWPAH